MRIAHLTDLHLRENLPGTSILPKRRSREARSLLAAALQDAHIRGASIVVLTGDLVDVPHYLRPTESVDIPGYRQRFEAMEADYRLIRELLDGSGLPYIVVPGNHDAYEVIERVFGGEPYVRDFGDLRFVSFWDHETEAHVPQRVGPERALFDRLLTDSDDRFQVHLQHFVITPELNKNWPHTYEQGEELRRRIVESGRVRLSLSGHYHPGTDLIYDGTTAFATGSAIVESPHAYRLYDIASAAQASTAPPVTMQVVELGAGQRPRPGIFLPYTSCFTVMPTSWAAVPTMQLWPGVVGALRDLSGMGYALVGLVEKTWAQHAHASSHLVHGVFDRAAELLAEGGVTLDAVYTGPGIGSDLSATVSTAAGERCLDLARSFLIAPTGPVHADTRPFERRTLKVVSLEPGGSATRNRESPADSLADAATQIATEIFRREAQ